MFAFQLFQLSVCPLHFAPSECDTEVQPEDSPALYAPVSVEVLVATALGRLVLQKKQLLKHKKKLRKTLHILLD